MENYKISIGIDPADEYEKAKKELFQAMDSFYKLTPQQQQRLAAECIEATKVRAMYNMLRQHFG